jgi:uncharacterized membrane protein YhiD involved in acid resistance
MAKKDRVEGGSAAATEYPPPPEARSPNGSAGVSSRASPPPDHGAWLIALGVILALLFVVVLISMPGSRPTTGEVSATPLPDNEFTRILGSMQDLMAPSGHSLPVVLGKLLLAALLGAVIGYRARIHVAEYILQAHVIIAFTGALMMIIIGNEIVRAFGLLGAGSIIRYRTPVRDPRALASLFVAMGLGIAVGVGLYELAFIGAVLIVLLQSIPEKVVGGLPRSLYNPQRVYTLSLTAEDGSSTIARLNQTFSQHDVRHRLLEYDARAKKDGLVKITMSIEANANMTTEDLALLVFKDGVQSVNIEEEGLS